MANDENLIPFSKGHKLATGRPKGSRNKSTIMKELLASTVNVDGKEITVEQQLLKKLHDLAKEGDLKAIALVLDGAFGKDKQVVDNVNTNINKSVELSEDERKEIIKDLKSKL